MKGVLGVGEGGRSRVKNDTASGFYAYNNCMIREAIVTPWSSMHAGDQ
jgi:hypothetical protein